MGKTIAWIVVAVAIVGGGVWWAMSMHSNANTNNRGVSATGGSSASSSLPQGNSDQAIAQDMTNVNAQLNGLNSDSASINQGLNDQPVSQ